MKKYSKYMVASKFRKSVFQFIEAASLPPDIPISTPFVFPFIEDKVVLCLDKNGWWNPLGGHLEYGETYQDALVREAYEEAGVHIDRSTIKVIGYIKNYNFEDSLQSKYPQENILPIAMAFITSIDPNWKPMETSRRKLFTFEDALKNMMLRQDNNQMAEILEFVEQKHQSEKYRANFTYHPATLIPNIPVTQVFTFCRSGDGLFCVVKDLDEKFYSLPGGSCEMGEEPESCARREIQEEAQMTCRNFKLLGSILVKLYKKGVVISSSQHLRYLADVDNLRDFIPLKDGYETNERKFIEFSELSKQVKLLQNPTAKDMLQQLSVTLEK